MSQSERDDDDDDPKTKLLKDQLNTASSQAIELGRLTRLHTAEKQRTSRKMDLIRRLVQLTCAVVIVLMVVLLIFTRTTIQHPHKYPAAAFFSIVCVAYMVSLELARGNFSVLLFLIIAGNSVTFFAFGYALGVLKQIAL